MRSVTASSLGSRNNVVTLEVLNAAAQQCSTKRAAFQLYCGFEKYNIKLHTASWTVGSTLAEQQVSRSCSGRRQNCQRQAFVWPSSFAPESRFLAARKEGVQDTFVKNSKFSKNVRVTFRQRYWKSQINYRGIFLQGTCTEAKDSALLPASIHVQRRVTSAGLLVTAWPCWVLSADSCI